MLRSELTAAFGDELTTLLTEVRRVASDASIPIYLVGGVLRDTVAGQREVVTSPDIAIIGSATTFADLLCSKLDDCTIEAVSEFHTARVRIGDRRIDIASAREDGYDPPGSLPKITLVDDIEVDLARRDYTVNAMAMPILPSGFGDLIDPFGGADDAQRQRLRIIHDDSFREDPLRILRGVRLAARYGFEFETNTENLVERSLKHLDAMVCKSPQRVFNEFRLWFDSKENLAAIGSIAERLGAMRALGIEGGVSAATLAKFRADAPPLERFAAFASTARTDDMDSLVRRLKMPAEWRRIVSEIEAVRRIADRCRTEAISDSELRRLLVDVRIEVIRTAIAIEETPVVTMRFEDFLARIRHIKAKLDGDDLIAMGVPRGPMIGELLEELLDGRVDGYIASKEQERTHVTERLAEIDAQSETSEPTHRWHDD